MDFSQDGVCVRRRREQESALCEAARKSAAMIRNNAIGWHCAFPAVNHMAQRPAYLRVRWFVIRHLGYGDTMGIVVRVISWTPYATRRTHPWSRSQKKKGTVVKIQASQGWENKLTWKTFKGQRRPGAWLSLSLFSQHHFRDHNPEKCTLRPRAPNRSAPPLSRTHTTALHSMDAECAKSARSKKTAYYLVQYAVWCTARRARSTPPPSFLLSLPPSCLLSRIYRI